MSSKDIFSINEHKPICTGTGLVALDIVISKNSTAKLWAGGSCGNVLTILSYLGWKTYPIARLGTDAAANELIKDLLKWKVQTSFILRSSTDKTPIVVERIGTRKSGLSWHRFEWICPNCGEVLPKYKPVLSRSFDIIQRKLPKAHVYYFDKIARSSIELAKLNRDRGALVVFEPSGIKDAAMFTECLRVTDILKYSHERLGDIQELTQGIKIPLQIETLGSAGLRYRISGNKKWKVMQAFSTTKVIDAAGAGDWCSAGIIHVLGRNGKMLFEKLINDDIEYAVTFGQALAALNCYYEGARGSMYNLSWSKFRQLVHSIWNGDSPLESAEERDATRVLKAFECICPACLNKKSKRVIRKGVF